jgi:hypothetical protein
MRYIDATYRAHVAKNLNFFLKRLVPGITTQDSRRPSLECSTVKANVYAVKIFFIASQDVSPLLSSGKYHNVKVWWAALTTSFLEAI